MKRSRKYEAITRQELLQLFDEIDAELAERGTSLAVTTIGGVSIILLGFRDRATVDIDIANGSGATTFQKLCNKKGIPVDIVTISSTVDFDHTTTVDLYQGKRLKVKSVTAEDLIKLKLERFRKQDPEDIYAVLEKTGMKFEKFKSIIKEMLLDFVGNPRELILSARLVVEQIYPGKISAFDVD